MMRRAILFVALAMGIFLEACLLLEAHQIVRAQATSYTFTMTNFLGIILQRPPGLMTRVRL